MQKKLGVGELRSLTLHFMFEQAFGEYRNPNNFANYSSCINLSVPEAKGMYVRTKQKLAFRICLG